MIAQVALGSSFIHLFNKYLSSTYHVPCTVIGVGETVMKKMGKNACLYGAGILVSTKQVFMHAFCYPNI